MLYRGKVTDSKAVTQGIVPAEESECVPMFTERDTAVIFTYLTVSQPSQLCPGGTTFTMFTITDLVPNSRPAKLVSSE